MRSAHTTKDPTFSRVGSFAFLGALYPDGDYSLVILATLS